MHSPFFGTDIQPKTIVSWYLGFLSGFHINKDFEEDLGFCVHRCFEFKNQAIAWFSWICLHLNEDKTEILFFFFHSTYQQDIIQNIIEVSHICRLVSFLYITQKICQICFSCSGRKPSRGRKPRKYETVIN